MSKLAISQTPTTITIVDQSTAKVYSITNTQPNCNRVSDAILKDACDDEIISSISVRGAIETFSPTGKIKVHGNDVLYNDRALHGLDVDHLLEAIRTGNTRQARALTAFLENKQLNPSWKAINMMYKFRQDRGMPLTDDGYFLAYKGVMSNYWSKHGNTETIVLSGAVDDGGHIFNGVGEYIEVDRKCVEDDPANACGEGLHAGSLEYATSWAELVVLVKIHPKDVVSVPNQEDEKMRICAYLVIGECEGKMPEHFAKELDNDDDTCSECGDDLSGDDCNCESEDYICPDCGDSKDPEDERCEYCQEDLDQEELADENYTPSDEEDEGDGSDDTYHEGFTNGTKDGKAHARREHHRSDESGCYGFVNAGDDLSYIQGYNDGYDKARYNK